MEIKKEKHAFRNALIRDIFELVKLNLIFVVCCLTVIGIPAGIAAMAKVNLQIQRGDTIYVIPDFLHEFRKGFISSTLCGLLLAGAAFVFAYVLWFYATMQIASSVIFVLLCCMTAIPLLVCYCAGCYLWVLNAMVEQPFGQRLRNAVLLSMICWKESGICLLAGIFICVVTYFGIPYTMPFILVFGMAFWSYTCVYYIRPVVERYVVAAPEDAAADRESEV